MRVRLLNRYYKFRRLPNLGSNLGTCDDPDGRLKEINIQAGLPEKEELSVVIHEAMHRLWHLDENTVDVFSEDLATLLYRLGWRKTEK